MPVEPLTKIPDFAHLPIPPKYAKGTEITNAQGQEMTRNERALYIQSLYVGQSYTPFTAQMIVGTNAATSIAAMTTAGV